MTISIIVFLALILDSLLGEPRRWHPLVGFGGLADRMEKEIYADSKLCGAFATAVLLFPMLLVCIWLQSTSLSDILLLVTLYIAIGRKSLAGHALDVFNPLQSENLPEARRTLSMIVSRDTGNANTEQISSAAVESVLENGNDALFGAIFWAVVAGIPGVIAYRLVNTLDAMWGYKTDRYKNFGWAAARLDDLLNYLPARLTALSYALAGNTRQAFECWKRQAHIWKSPNAGPVMAAGAGSLSVLLGGNASYRGVLQNRPDLGIGKNTNANDIKHSIALVDRALILWISVLLLIDVFLYWY